MAEYVCADGRMSVNGICSVLNQNDGSNNIIPTKTFDQKYESIEDIPTKDYSKDVKSNFQWDFDKVGNKIANFGTTVKGNINAYDDYIEENFGIPKAVNYGTRAVSVGMGISSYGAVGALVPFAIPFMAGGALNNKQKKENERITQATMKDNQGDISTIDMATYGMPTYGDVGFNIHNDAGDQGNSGSNDYGSASAGGGFDAGGFEQDGTGRQGY
jgi:hypothetical protein